METSLAKLRDRRLALRDRIRHISPLSRATLQDSLTFLHVIKAPKRKRDESAALLDTVDALLAKRTSKETQALEVLSLFAPTAKERSVTEQFKTKGGKAIREFCPIGTRDDCQRKNGHACSKVHFRRIIQSHTDPSMGDCSYLDTCRHMKSCKFLHYDIEKFVDEVPFVRTSEQMLKASACYPPQWLNIDVRSFDFSVLGKFSVIMADPPWDIHMTLPYGTMSDDEMRNLRIPELCDDGFIFLWVTGRAMELGRECLLEWGYKRVNEIVWIKTNQLQRIIRTGRTGHWLNHSKEHCLVGVKGNPKSNVCVDVDVLCAEVRETSRKPDEIYAMIERLSPGTRKLEIFGRPHNTMPGWLTLGNQLNGTMLHDPELIARYNSKYPDQKYPGPSGS